MYSFTRRFRIGAFDGTAQIHQVFTEDEAVTAGITTTPWQTVPIPQAWVRTDDGFAAEVIDVTDCIDRQGRLKHCITLSYCRYWTPGTRQLNFMPFFISKNFGGCRAYSWDFYEGKKERTRRVVSLYCAMLISANQIDWALLANAFRCDQKQPIWTVKRLFKSNAVKNMVDTKLRELLEARGLTPGKILDMLLASYETAKEQEKPREMLACATHLQQIVGIDRVYDWDDGYDQEIYENEKYMVSQRPPPPKIIERHGQRNPLELTP